MRRSMLRKAALALTPIVAVAGLALAETPATAAELPRPAHVVVAVLEKPSDSSILDSGSAPYITQLAAQGASFTNFHAITHPSQPNFLALFSGSTQGVADSSCPHTFDTANLGSELYDAGLTFAGYSESMPSEGYTGCEADGYVRRHNPWVNFSNVPATANRTFDAFPSDYATLPTVSFVVPNLSNDMHDGSVERGDGWLREHLGAYAEWAKTHNSQLIVTWAEGDDGDNNRIPTIIVGEDVKPGTYDENLNHYNLLRTIENYYDLSHAGASADATPVTAIFAADVTVARQCGASRALCAPCPADRRASVGAADRGSATAKYHWWKNQVYRDDFCGSSLGDSWAAYDSAGHNGNGTRSPEQIAVSNGILRMTGTADGTTAGMSSRYAQQYGRWEVRARFPAGCGCYHPVLILWPESGNWPEAGEIDFAEVFGADRQKVNFILHYSAEDRQLSSSLPIDTTQWHHYAVEWTPDHIIGYVDGEEFFSTDRLDVQPPGPMAQTVQLDWFPEVGTGTGAVLEVDWAAMYTL
jgi:phosphatidylinositol-3-phosphatase